jgi:hypothetical protein
MLRTKVERLLKIGVNMKNIVFRDVIPCSLVNFTATNSRFTAILLGFSQI